MFPKVKETHVNWICVTNFRKYIYLIKNILKIIIKDKFTYFKSIMSSVKEAALPHTWKAFEFS